MATYHKAKDVFTQRRTIDNRFEEYALIVSPNSFVMFNGAMDMVTLSTASIGGLIGDSYTVKASISDDIPNFLENKLVAGTNILITKLNTGDNESLSITATGTLTTGSRYPITASYALVTQNAGTLLTTGSTYPITSSWARSASYASHASVAESIMTASYASWALTASVALNAQGGGTSLSTGSTYPITSSWAQLATSASSAATAYLATTASQAYYAPTANSASWATSASFATHAWSASNAGTAFTASKAASAYLATTASNAASASFAVYAYSASNASVAFTASSAASAYFATTASQAYYAPTANSASWATSASFATHAWSASNAGTALTASKAASAYLATTASSAATAYFATTASFATSASFARWATTASFAISASSAASAYFATTASQAYYAPTANTASYSLTGLSASYAVTTSYYVSSQIYSLNTTQSMFATNSVAANSSIYASQSLWASSSLTSTSSLSASYALTASYALNSSPSGTSLNTGSTYPITSSWAQFATSASNAATAYLATTASQAYYAPTANSASWATSASFSTYAWSASNAGIAFTASNAASASFAKWAWSASFATSASSAASAYSATTSSYAATSSYALNSSPGGTSLTTASSYPITASWAISAFTASYATGSLEVDGIITASNINNGIPQSFTWGSGLEGSYFANWNSATYVSEMLRFFAGAFSSSFPNPSPNTRTYSNITVNQNNQGSTVTINGRVPSGSTNVNLNYIVSNGWATTGSQVFASPTFRNSQTFNTTYDSVIGGSTAVSSPIGAQAFGLGTLNNGNLQTFNVSSSVQLNVYLNTGSVVAYTTTTKSLYSQTLENTTGTAISLAKIPSANPAVIPSAYQDGRYAGITGSALRWNGGTNDLTNISASGKYEITTSVGIASGSSLYSYLNATSVNYYFTPITDGTFATNTLAAVNFASGSLVATSRSFSGVPYLSTGSTWYYTFTGSGAFDPLYNNGVISQIVSGSNAASASTYSARTASVVTTNGTVNAGNTIVNSSTLVARPFGTLPVQSDYVVYSIVLVASGSVCTNITRSGVSNNGIPISASMLTRAGATTFYGQMTIPYHIPGTFGQPVSSGSLVYWGRPASFSVSTVLGTSETFMDEAQRVYLSNGCLSFTSSYVTSSQYIDADELQVKPGFLVSPSGSYRYWYPSGYGVETKYYVRRFRRSTTVTQLIIDPLVSIINWDDTTTPGISMALLFESAKLGVYGNCRLYDINKLVGSINNNVIPDGFQNPFNQNVDIYYNGTGNKSGTQITVPIVNANGMYLDGTADRDEFYLIIRYKGDPSPLMRVSVA